MQQEDNDFFASLTSAQREAVTHLDGPMLVVAGAGSGKTRVVTYRIAWLLKHGIYPDQILTMTFTNKAAGEMKARVTNMTGLTPRWMGTFHSICAQLLRRWMDEYSQDPRNGRFTIYDTDDQKKMVKNLLKQHGIDDKKGGELSVNQVVSAISAMKSNSLSLLALNDKKGAVSYELQAICDEYEQALKTANALDFDDLLWVTVKMLQDCPHILSRCHAHFRYIMVDEYQDTNHVQYLLLRLLAGENANLHVTGDPDQSIYSWRGALYRNIMEFTDDYENAKVVRLERNYRSSGNILKMANELISHNFNRIEKNLYTEDEDGELITFGTFWGDREEAAWVVEQIMKEQLNGFHRGDFAIFYRTNAQSRALEDVLLRMNIPYQIIGGVRFYERKEIRDFIAYLRLMATPEDFLAFDRVLSSRSFGVGKTSLSKLQQFATERHLAVVPYLLSNYLDEDWKKTPVKIKELAVWLRGLLDLKKIQGSLFDLVKKTLDYSGLLTYYNEELKKERLEKSCKKGEFYPSEERMHNLESFVDKAQDFSGDLTNTILEDFLAEVALNSTIDEMQDYQEKVTLMTLHCSKGLEYPCVFITGLEQGLLPHVNSFAKGERDIEEERRLFYVGITRAEKKLYLSMASSRYCYGSVKTSAPSQFLKELPKNCMKVIGEKRSPNLGYDRVEQRFAIGGRQTCNNYDLEKKSNNRFNNQQWLKEHRKNNNTFQDNYYDHDDF